MEHREIHAIMTFSMVATSSLLMLIIATITTISLCEGLAFPLRADNPVTWGNAGRNRIPAKIVLHHRGDSAGSIRTKSVALASFDFFTPVDDFYDDVDDLYSETKSSKGNDNWDDDSESTGDHEVHWLDPEMEGLKSLGEAIADGEAVVSIPDMADFEECYDLVSAGLNACKMRNGQTSARGRSRFSVSDPTAFDSSVVLTCEEILLRVLDHLDEHVPSIYETLFRPGEDWAWRQPLNAQLEQPSVPPPEHLAETCGSLRELYLLGELEWSEGEPAINVYESEGYFGCHKDHLALTVLIPLTSPGNEFAGGGTGYWRGNREVDENPQTPPDLVLKPEKGAALVFGGDVTHSGMPVEAGYRSVFVCSFSTRTPVSPANRLQGMQAPPEVSANFKGTY